MLLKKTLIMRIVLLFELLLFSKVYFFNLAFARLLKMCRCMYTCSNLLPHPRCYSCLIVNLYVTLKIPSIILIILNRN